MMAWTISVVGYGVVSMYSFPHVLDVSMSSC